jgi:hypothetical protein
MAIRKCKNCAKEIPEYIKIDFCSKDCQQEFKEKTESAEKSSNNGNNKVGLRFGSGGERRESNILAIKNAIISGISEEKIMEEGELWFSREKLQVYINIAKRLIEKESN